MFKNIVFVVFLFSCLPVAGYASIVGKWPVKGTMTQTVKITGFQAETTTVKVRDVFTFSRNKNFVSYEGIGGNWVRKGQSFYVSLNENDIERVFSSLASEEGLSIINFQAPKAYIKGKILKETNISGTLFMDMSFAVSDFNGNIINLFGQSSMSFTGKKRVTPSIFAKSSTNQTQLNNLMRVILKSFVEDIKLPR